LGEIIMKNVFAAATLFCVCLCLSAQAYAQSNNATVSGTVSDSSGAFIPGVMVTATNIQTGVVTTALSNETGTYNLPNLQPGTYKVSGELPGFQTQTYTNVELGNAQQVRLNFNLQVNTVAQAVEVTVAADTLLATTSASVGNVLPENRVRDLPVIGRDALDLVTIQAGFRENQDMLQSNMRATATIAGISVTAANTTRDGISVQDNRYNLGVFSATHLNPDMVGEMRVILAPVDAETGRGAGQVQILTRSGTNRFQGSAVWNVQNSALNANTWNNNRTGADKTWFNRQQLSVNYGGPIIKNKTFFFALFDGQRMYSRENVLATVLTKEARQGLFRYFPGVVNGPADSPVTGGVNPSAPVVDALGNPVRPAAATGDLQSFSVFGPDPNRPGFDKTGYVQRVLAAMPLPNDFKDGGDGLNTAVFRWVRRGDSIIGGQQGLEDDINRNQINFKIDHNLSQKHKFNVAFSNEHLNSTTGRAAYPSETKWTGITYRKPMVITSSLVSTLSSNIVNEARFGLRRSDSLTQYPWDHPGTKDAVLAFLPNAGAVPFQGVPNTGTGATGINLRNNIVNQVAGNTNGNKSPLWTYADSLSWTKGKHSFKGGAELRLSRSWGINSASALPTVTNGAGNVTVAGIETARFPGLIGNNLTLARNLLIDLNGSVGSVTQAFILNDPNWTDFRGFGEPDGYFKERQWNQNEWSAFFKDDWKVRPSLTLNVGMRYEFYGVPYEAAGLTAALIGGGNAAFGYSGRSFSDYWNYGPRKGDDSAVEFIGPHSPNPGKQLYKTDWNNWAPAVGFSWSLPWFGKDKTTIRGGYGVSYQGGGRGLDLDNAVSAMPGLGDTPNITPTGFTDFSNLVLPLARNKPLQPVPLTQRNTNLTAWDPNDMSPYVQNFTFSVTRELVQGFTLDVRYIGTKGTKLFGGIPVNQGNFSTNGLLEALNAVRAGGESTLLDQMFKGINLAGAGFGPIGTTLNGVPQTAALQLRQSTTYRGNIATGNYSSIVAGGTTSFNESTITGVAGGLLRNANLPENFIVNNPQFRNVSINSNPGDSVYHSLQTQFTMRPLKGLQYQATYVWSKGISDCQGTSCSTWLNAVDRNLNRTLQASDRRHDFRANGTYELPFGPNRMFLSNSHGVIARVVEGWQMSWILNLTSGGPLDITGANTFLNGVTTPVGTTGGLVDIAGAFPKDIGKAQMTSTLPVFFAPGTFKIDQDPQCLGVTEAQGTRTACTLQAIKDAQGNTLLQNAQPGKRGNMGQSWVTGPGSFRFDLSAAKNVRLTESKSLQFRLDAKNVLNHPILGVPDLNINSPTFGQIPATINPPGSAVNPVQNITGSRQFQAQLRLNF
jgi:hypothetical protein